MLLMCSFLFSFLFIFSSLFSYTGVEDPSLSDSTDPLPSQTLEQLSQGKVIFFTLHALHVCITVVLPDQETFLFTLICYNTIIHDYNMH